MNEPTGIKYFIVAATLIMLLLGSGIIWFVILYQRRVLRSQQELKAAEEQKEKDLLNASIQSEENERMRIAAELHDDVAPTLASIKLYLSSAGKLSGENDLLNTSRTLLDGSLQKIRDISHKLQPSTLSYLGLQTAIKSFTEILDRSNQLSVRYEQQGDFPEMEEQRALNLYRVVQELVNNLLKHARPTDIRITTGYQGQQLDIWIAHNGKGITQEEYDQLLYKKDAIGLKNILSRLRAAEAAIHFSLHTETNTYLIHLYSQNNAYGQH
jgi:two-component system NarL family sensor kinase